MVLLVGCGDAATTSGPYGSSATAAGSGATSSAAASVSPPVSGSASTAESGANLTEITTGSSDFGPMLFDARGQAIYLFAKERTSVPECYGACATAWPPVLADGAPQSGGEARPALLGTTTREDGSTQVTYAGHPLYYYAHEGPGQVLCHGVREFGGLWLVVTPSGAPAD